MSSSSTVTGPRGSSPPRRSMSGMAFSPTGHCDEPAHRDRLTDWRGHAPQTVLVVVLVADLVQEFVHRLTDTLEPTDLGHCQIGMGDVPAFCRDLVPGEVVLRLRAANPRPAFESTIQDIQVVGNL